MGDGQELGRHLIGSRTRRFDALEKVTGRARYLADLTLPGMLHGALLEGYAPWGMSSPPSLRSRLT